VFIFVGFIPNTGLVDRHIDHDAGGYYLADPMTMMTNVPGIFAAGDVRSQLTRQITTAVGDATTATIAASKWVEERARGHEDDALDMLADAALDGGWVA
jgi:thioredoxin reductase (NADPH)